MNHTTVDFDDETKNQIRQLAEWWGLPPTRHIGSVIARCVERVYRDEKARRELERFDHLQRTEPDPLE